MLDTKPGKRVFALEEQYLLQIIGKNIDRWRKERGLTIEELAEQVGMTNNNVSPILKGTKTQQRSH